MAIVAIVTIVLSSCNHDVFVPETVPSAMAIYLDGDGDSSRLIVSPKKLQAIRVYPGFCSARAYDSAGKLVCSIEYSADDDNMTQRYIDLPRDGRLEICEDGITSLNIYMQDGDKLEFVLDEYLCNANAFAPKIEMELLYDKGVRYNIPILISKNSGYEVEKLEFDTVGSTVNLLWSENPVRYRYDNKGTSESSALIDAFANEKNYIFYNFPVNIYQVLASNRYIFDYPVYYSGKIEFVFGMIFGESKLPISSEYYFIALPPMTSTLCEVYVQTSVLKVKSTLLLRNVATERLREYKGDVTTSIKIASKVKITRTPIDETKL